MQKLFGTDGIRGNVNSFVFNPDFIQHITYCAAKALNLEGSVLIGCDPRESSKWIEDACIQGFASAKIHCVKVGIIPTAALGYLVSQDDDVQMGLMISASHNPYHDNGLKFFNHLGQKLNDSSLEKIETYIHCHQVKKIKIFSQAVSSDKKKYYEQLLLEKAKKIHLPKMKMIIDCANGAASLTAKKIFEQTQATVLMQADQPNGKKINHQCGTVHIQSILDLVKKNHADLGIAFDGDADRLMIVDSFGKILDGNDLLVILAKPYLFSKTLNEKVGVAGSLMVNQGVEDYFLRQNIPFIRTGIGDCELAKKLRQHAFFLGAEPCGHVLDFNTGFQTGDGLLNALSVLEYMSCSKSSLSEMTQVYEKYPQVNTNIALKPNWPDFKSPIIQDFLDEQTVYCKKFQTRILVRPSGTEPVIRILLEGKDKRFLTHQIKSIAMFFDHLNQ